MVSAAATARDRTVATHTKPVGGPQLAKTPQRPTAVPLSGRIRLC